MESVEYFKQNISSVPVHIPVLVVANFRDVRDDWKVSTEELQQIIEQHIINEGNKDVISFDPNLDNQDSNDHQFQIIMGEVYSGRRRVIKLIETSFLEKFGLHV